MFKNLHQNSKLSWHGKLNYDKFELFRKDNPPPVKKTSPKGTFLQYDSSQVPKRFLSFNPACSLNKLN